MNSPEPNAGDGNHSAAIYRLNHLGFVIILAITAMTFLGTVGEVVLTTAGRGSLDRLLLCAGLLLISLGTAIWSYPRVIRRG